MEAKFETTYELIIAKNNGKKYAVELYSKWEYQYTSIQYDKTAEYISESEEKQIKFLQNAIKSSIDNRLRLYNEVKE